jgi:hypothetical protein
MMGQCGLLFCNVSYFDDPRLLKRRRRHMLNIIEDAVISKSEDKNLKLIGLCLAAIFTIALTWIRANSDSE